ncbi:TOMM precursor leader peptide-binding protein [Nocardioides dongkuii]|uniref:TOMM precursor leader peptide-binding protein n=1 Tax=Nocardioides dongkuii TaxID=2760089 RepID=UPI0015F7EDBB|nr:TOMM precursor leader peptide-binding protein [Nocardioides dongkuii]
MLPDRPALPAGVPVVRRDDHHLQVGIDPPRCAVLPDEPDVRRVVEDLRAGRRPAPATTTGHRALERLVAAGLVDDLDEVERRAAARAEVRVGLDVPGDLVRACTERLGTAGLAVADRDHPASVLLVVRDGPVPRRLLDRCAREGLPHLLVGAEPGAMTLGPFVEPGRTACARCVDAHLALVDPRRPLLLEQARVLVPRDPALHPLALAWAVADLVAWAEGRAPSTRSATLRLDADLRARRTPWSRHPACGCAWDEVSA